MLKLHAIQARFGDCLLIEFLDHGESRFILIDGGPAGTYEASLKQELSRLVGPLNRLELVILSHVDRDHVDGLIEMFTDLRAQRDTAGGPEALVIAGIWHNAFGQALGEDVATRLSDMVVNAPQMASASFVLQGYSEGGKLRLEAMLLGVPINQGFDERLVSVENAPAQAPILGDLTLTVVGPTKGQLDELRKKWLTWLNKHEDHVAVDPATAAMADRSVPNLSSIMVIANAGGKRILLTGDGRGDHLLEGLGDTGLLDETGSIHVDVLKVAHHGSDRNTTLQFHQKVKADTYVISADGKDGNPDSDTLRWIVESAQAQNRRIKLVATNQTPSLQALVQSHPPAHSGYELLIKPLNQHSVAVALA